MYSESEQQVLSSLTQKIQEQESLKLPFTPDSVSKLLSSCSGLNENFLEAVPRLLSQTTFSSQTFNGQDFSQFPFTVLNSCGLNLDLYFWNKGHTSIHDHNFHGAFKVLRGTYRQLRFKYRIDYQPFPWLAIGSLDLVSFDVLNPGDVIKIDHGDDFIHFTHHGNTECVTACLRTQERFGPIHSYLQPSIRISYNPWSREDLKRLDYIRYLLQTGSDLSQIQPILSVLELEKILQLIFAFNIPQWMQTPIIRDACLVELKRKYYAETWFNEVESCLKNDHINKAKMAALFNA